MTSKIQDHVAQIFCGLMYVWKEEKGFLKGKKKKKRHRRQKNAESIYCSEFYKRHKAGYRQVLVC